MGQSETPGETLVRLAQEVVDAQAAMDVDGVWVYVRAELRRDRAIEALRDWLRDPKQWGATC
jgi:DNA-binding transcriptional LysR family regulator